MRHPIDFALTPDDVAFILNRGREDRPDGTQLTVIRLGEEGEEYISEFGSYGEGAGQFDSPPAFASNMMATSTSPIGQNNRVIIADTTRHRFQIYRKNTEPVLL